MERLQKVIAESGLTSRRKAEELITAGKVKVNGQTVTELGTKVSGKYNEQEFSNMYEQYEASSENENKRVVGLFTGIKTVKEAYIQDNTNAYLNFKVKTVTYIVIYILTILVMIYLAYRLKKNEDQKDRLEKDDEILYDEEENVKM